MSICPNISEVKFDYLVKVEAAKLFHCKVTMFCFLMNK